MTLPEQQLIEDMKGKIVVVGDFEEDTHDTYMSKQPGPYLTYLAYKYLARGGNKISFPVIVLMTLIYFFIVKLILSGRPLIPWGKHRATRIFTALLSYSFILSLICMVVFLITGYAFNVMVPSLIISCVSAVKDSEDKPSKKTAEK